MKRLKLLTIFFVLFFCVGCSKEEKKEKTFNEEYYGAEIYNASYLYFGEDVRHIIPVMSKKDLTKINNIEIESDGGSFDYSYFIEDGEYDLENHHLYRIVLDFMEPVFEADCINISNIKVILDDGTQIEFKPDKCEIAKTDMEYDPEHININGAPLKIPSDMTEIPLELSSDEEIIIKNIYLTNDSLKVGSYIDNSGEISEDFKEISLNTNIVTWYGCFGLENTEYTLYKNYGTSIVIEYEYNGEMYFTVPAVPRMIYNPFDTGYDGIENYYNALKGE